MSVWAGLLKKSATMMDTIHETDPDVIGNPAASLVLVMDLLDQCGVSVDDQGVG